jgi:3' terminal RNA ribose 2'-O-methyltransferase Hen1
VLLTITTTCEPATDLGYLLHKHPDRVQSVTVAGGEAHVFYPEATAARCTAALLLEVDPIALVRGGEHERKNDGKHSGELAHYVNDRPYAASSMLAVALKQAFRTALTGRCEARQELAEREIPLDIRVPALRCNGGADLANRMFGPLGWTVTASAIRLDPPEWGDSPYLDLRLNGELRLKDALNHLYVLLPALDDAKHYWVSTDEVDKLIRAGGDWLASHQEKALITQRYLAHQRSLAESALARLAAAEDTEPERLDNAVADNEQEQPLSVRRRGAVMEVLRELKARTVGDFGCGAGALTRDLLGSREFDLVVATDVSARALRLAAGRLGLDSMAERARLKIFQSALTYRDDRLAGLDAAVLMEVIEHVDPARLPALEQSVFGFAAPGAVVVTTPNAEYNVHFENLAPGAFRHRDHRFEWTRAEFSSWARRVAADYGYQVGLRSVGAVDAQTGSPTQLALFTRGAS